MMDCKACRERLPWLLNETLEGEEEASVREHLEGCAECRAALQETEVAWSLHEGHLPAEALVDYSLGLPLSAGQRKIVKSHLATCPQCADELALLQEGAAAAESEGDSGARPGGAPWLRVAALAATLAAVVCGAGWWFTALQLAAQRSQPPQPSASARAPRLNTPILELIPATPGAQSREATLDTEGLINPWDPASLPTEADEVVLTLLSGELRCAAGCTVEILRADGSRVWQSGGLRATADGHATLTLPRSLLPSGSWTVLLHDSESSGRSDPEGLVIRYRIAAP